MKNFGFGFKDAFGGILHALLCEQNFRVHVLAVFTVIYFGVVFGISRTEWAILVLCMGAVIAAELVNTAVEAVVDKVSPKPNHFARIAKDCAAAAVLILALTSVAVAVFVFSKPAGWIRVWEYIKGNYIWLIIFALLGVAFIFGKTKEKKV